MNDPYGIVVPSENLKPSFATTLRLSWTKADIRITIHSSDLVYARVFMLRRIDSRRKLSILCMSFSAAFVQPCAAITHSASSRIGKICSG